MKELSAWIVVLGASAAATLSECRRRADASRTRADIAALRAEDKTLRELAATVPRDPVVYQLADRTEYLRTVLRVLVRETYESGDRVRLPDPPPGWPEITLSSDESKSNGHSATRAWRNQ